MFFAAYPGHQTMFQNMHKNSIVKSPRVVLITGASSGLGQSIARQLCRSGHEVYGTSRNGEAQEHFTMLPLDLTCGTSIAAAVREVIARSGRIDVLINNAGVDGAGPMEAMSDRHIAYLFQVNVFGAARLTNEVLPHMRRYGAGLIINISSLAAVNGLPYRGIYSASKAALERLTESLRMELAPAGIKAC
ncbi:MAG: SDR family oxidoreductase, partial [Chitinophagaceae bacterium]